MENRMILAFALLEEFEKEWKKTQTLVKNNPKIKIYQRDAQMLEHLREAALRNKKKGLQLTGRNMNLAASMRD